MKRSGGGREAAASSSGIDARLGSGAKPKRGRRSSAGGLEEKLDTLTREFAETLEYQAATTQVLETIARSAFDLPQVLDDLLRAAARLSQADIGTIRRREGDTYTLSATYGCSPEWKRDFERYSRNPNRGSAYGRAVIDGRTVHIPDVLADAEFTRRDAQKLMGFRAALAVPLVRDGRVIGVLILFRFAPRSFTESQIKRVETFASQAVIAIENTKLVSELDRRNSDLRATLEQQTATAEILRSISTSLTDRQPVFETIVRHAVALCDSVYANVYSFDGKQLHLVASRNVGPSFADLLEEKYPMCPDTSQVSGRVILEKQIIRLEDALADPDYDRRFHTAMGCRKILGLPMLRDGEPLGVIVVGWAEPGSIPKSQEDLLKTFADQAVIAIENGRLFTELATRNRDLTAALEQQTATADVLKVISRSTFDLATVLDTLTKSAARLCEAEMAGIARPKDDAFYWATSFGFPPAFSEWVRTNRLTRGKGSGVGRALVDGRIAHIPDVLDDPEYAELEAQKLGGVRTLLAVPMLREGTPIGVIVLTRRIVLPFTEKQVDLVTSFADQAVIAIENTRLLNELRESLQQQTATADVLKVISRSAFDLPTVLQTLVESAAQLCEADKATITRQIDGVLYRAEAFGFPPEFLEHFKAVPIVPERGTASGRVLLEGQVVHIADVEQDPDYTWVEAQRLGNFRTILAVPMLREGVPIGVLALIRTEVRPFTSKQIELASTFADQAVIAIENVRLFTELEARNRELSEALEQQTATGEVLNAISRSPSKLQPVLDTIMVTAGHLCHAEWAMIFKLEADGKLHAAASQRKDYFAGYIAERPITPDRGTVTGRTALEGRTVHVADVLEDPEYTFFEGQSKAGYRTVLGVPLMRGSELIGVIILARDVVEPFTKKQIELVTTFADQAVIAIENVRLFDEVQARTRDLTRSVSELRALGEVSQAVSSTLDLETVLETIVSRAVDLARGHSGIIYEFEEEKEIFNAKATHRISRDHLAVVRAAPIRLGEGVIGRAGATQAPAEVTDIAVQGQMVAPQVRDILVREGVRSLIALPLVREGSVLGGLVILRREQGAFASEVVDTLQTFAAQSALAIQNARLFKSVEARTGELARSLEDLRTAQDRLVQTEKLASLGQLTAGIAHEIKNPLNFVNNFSSVSAELVDELTEALRSLGLQEEAFSDIHELAVLLRGNLGKIIEHGKRADSIVKNMLLHARQGSKEHRCVAVNALVEESLNLAYHGARAERQGFNVTIARDLDPAAGEADLFPQEITRVLLNLISNGFYALMKRKSACVDADYQPTLIATTRNLGDKVEIAIRDNGTGISTEVMEKLFSPFFTTKPAGEGTGLGLSISHDIVVKLHGGSLEIDTRPGEFTEFRILLPRKAAVQHQDQPEVRAG